MIIVIIETINPSKVVVHKYLQQTKKCRKDSVVFLVDESNNNLKVCSEKPLSKNP